MFERIANAARRGASGSREISRPRSSSRPARRVGLTALCLTSLVSAAAAVVLLAASPTSASAAPAVSVTNQTVSNNFPGGIEWTISFDSSLEAVDGALRYKFEPFGITSTAETTCDTEGCTAVLEYPGDTYIPPYTTITYFWELEDGRDSPADPADEVLTDEQTFQYLDTRFEWQTISEDDVLLHYHDGSDDGVEELLAASDETIDYWSEIFGIEITFPVNIVVYSDADELRGALPINSSSFEEEVITCGSQVAPDIVLMANVECITPDVTDVLRHELTHLVVEEALRGPFGNIPLWLNEGAAVYSQTTPGSYEPEINAAIRRDELLTINQISSSPGDPQLVLIFYGQSWSLVNYLISEYGEEKFGELFAQYREGSASNQAFEEVYGFDLIGLENEWRESVGLEARDRSEPTVEEPEEPEAATSDVSESEEEDDVSRILLIVIVGGVTLALISLILVGGLYLTRAAEKKS
jgi:Peptidase MA superfamily